MLHQNVPFFPNTADNTHCFQAALRMVLKYFQPEKDFTWQRLDQITAKKEGLWTWPYAGVVWIVEQGFEVASIERFDNRRFVEEGVSYLKSEYPEIAAEQIAHSDIQQEQALGKLFVEKANTETKIPTRGAMKSLLHDGHLIICNVNSSALNSTAGYAGHFVVVIDVSKDAVTFHDPGPPGIAYRRVSHSTFEKAWAYPTPKAKNLLAFRYPMPEPEARRE